MTPISFGCPVARCETESGQNRSWYRLSRRRGSLSTRGKGDASLFAPLLRRDLAVDHLQVHALSPPNQP